MTLRLSFVFLLELWPINTVRFLLSACSSVNGCGHGFPKIHVLIFYAKIIMFHCTFTGVYYVTIASNQLSGLSLY